MSQGSPSSRFSPGLLDALADEAVETKWSPGAAMDDMSVDVFADLDDSDVDSIPSRNGGKSTPVQNYPGSPIVAESPIPLSKRVWKPPRAATPAVRQTPPQGNTDDDDDEDDSAREAVTLKQQRRQRIQKTKNKTSPSPSPPWLGPGVTLVPSPPSSRRVKDEPLASSNPPRRVLPKVKEEEEEEDFGNVMSYGAMPSGYVQMWQPDDSPHRRVERALEMGRRLSDDEGDDDDIVELGSFDLLEVESQGQKRVAADPTKMFVFNTPPKSKTAFPTKITPRIRRRIRPSDLEDSIESPSSPKNVLAVDEEAAEEEEDRDESPVSVPSDIDARQRRRRAKRERAKRDARQRTDGSSGSYQLQRDTEVPGAQPLDADYVYMSQRPDTVYLGEEGEGEDEDEDDDDDEIMETPSSKRSRTPLPPASQKRTADSAAFAYTNGVLERRIFSGAENVEATALFIVQIRDPPRRVAGIHNAKKSVVTVYDPVSDGQEINKTRYLHQVHQSDDGLTRVYRIEGAVSVPTLSAMIRYLAFHTDKRARESLLPNEYANIKYYWSYWIGGAL